MYGRVPGPLGKCIDSYQVFRLTEDEPWVRGVRELVMPRYFLHVVNGDDRTEDPDGAEFVDLAAAKREAIECARELVSRLVLAGSPLVLGRHFQIANKDGQVVARVSFGDAIQVE
jgi:Domain of unknown function (DUF6894)